MVGTMLPLTMSCVRSGVTDGIAATATTSVAATAITPASRREVRFAMGYWVIFQFRSSVAVRPCMLLPAVLLNWVATVKAMPPERPVVLSESGVPVFQVARKCESVFVASTVQAPADWVG